MNSARNASICWNFINGSCRFGARCIYRHEFPVAPSALICRYFQKGGCWYGERCRFLHVLQPATDTGVAGRRGSMPVVSSSSTTTSVGHAWPDRRGSEPALLQSDLLPREVCSRSQLGVNISNSPLATDTVEQTQETDSPLTTSGESTRSSEAALAGACNGSNEQETSTETTENGAAAAASGSQGEMEVFLQSKNVTCGICMEKVYEKADPRRHVFGILPNCNHSFCLLCIMTWRKTRDLGPDVVKTCPQCRVKSAFYVPNKYWVEGKAKQSVVATFKKKCSKKSCSHYARHRWCPFKSDCLYRHDRPAHHPSFLYATEEDSDADDYDGVDLLNFFIAMTLLGGEDDDDDLDFPFYLTEEYGF